MSFGDFVDVLESHARATPHKVCLHVDDAVITWRELHERARDGALLIRERIGSGAARVALRVDEPAAFLCALFAVIRSGAAAVPVPARLR